MFSTLSARLFALIAAIALLGLGGLAWVEVKSHTRHLEDETIRGALRLSDTIRRSTRSSMLKNQKDDVYDIIQNVAAQPGIERIRLFKKDGRILYSSLTDEKGIFLDIHAEACVNCHTGKQPPENTDGCRERTRIITAPDGHRVLGLITPVYNEPTCTGATCHATVESEPVLGVLDVQLSLKYIDDSLILQNRNFLLFTYLFMLGIALTGGLFVWRFVHIPVRALIRGTEQLSRGNLDHRLNMQSDTEMGRLATGFNQMAGELELARQQLTDWARTLEQRVEEKTNILKQAQVKLIQNEKMASLGTLSAAVAHEINNPLSGVLTYTRLLRKLLNRDVPPPERIPDMRKYLEVIADEITRCGKIVSNLLEFSRQSNMRVAPTNINTIVERTLFLIGHKLELQNIQLQRNLHTALPEITCDADQIQQALLALLINAIEAMPNGGILTIATQPETVSQEEGIILTLSDTGYGISMSHIPRVFEPFFTTKQDQKGVGLGLSLVYGIVKRHGGRINVQSEEGQGTTFKITLPRQTKIAENDTANFPVFEGASA